MRQNSNQEASARNGNITTERRTTIVVTFTPGMPQYFQPIFR